MTAQRAHAQCWRKSRVLSVIPVWLGALALLWSCNEGSEVGPAARLDAIGEAYCDLVYDCGVVSTEAVLRCSLFPERLADVWEDPECLAECVQETSCADLESGAEDAWASCGCAWVNAEEACSKAEECAVLDTSLAECVRDPGAALDVPEYSLACVTECFRENACADVATVCNNLRPGTQCFIDSDEVPPIDLRIPDPVPSCVPGETRSSTCDTCCDSWLQAVDVCDARGFYSIIECRDLWATAGSGGGASGSGGASGGGATGGASGSGMTIGTGTMGLPSANARGTAACHEWQDAACDLVSDLCGWRPRETCDAEFWSYDRQVRRARKNRLCRADSLRRHGLDGQVRRVHPNRDPLRRGDRRDSGLRRRPGNGDERVLRWVRSFDAQLVDPIVRARHCPGSVTRS